MGVLWTAMFAPVVLIFTLAISLAICISGLVDRTGWAWWRIGRFWGWAVVRLSGATGVKTSNIERLNGFKGAIFMANHESNLDPPLLIGLSKEPVRFVTKHSLFWVPIFGQALWVVGMIPVNRDRRDKAIDSLQQAANRIKEGRVVLVFPEGKRSPTDALLPFKKGGFMLALQAGVPIIPIGIAGTQRVLPPGWNPISFGQVSVSVGEPILTEGMDISHRKQLMDQVEASILEERARAREMLKT